MARLTAERRRALPKSAFAVPDKDAYPDDTPRRARAALSLVSQHGTPAEKQAVRAKVKRDYPGIRQSAGKPAKGGANARLARRLTDRLNAKDR